MRRLERHRPYLGPVYEATPHDLGEISEITGARDDVGSSQRVSAGREDLCAGLETEFEHRLSPKLIFFRLGSKWPQTQS